MSLIKIKSSNIETTGVVAGSYTAADITVNEQGQVTSASNGTGGGGGGGSGLQHTTYTYTANGSTTTFAATSGITANTVLVLIDGITQVPTTDYTVSGSNVVFTSAPPNNAVIQIRVLGDVAASGVGGPKIASIQVTDSSYNNLDDTAVNVSGGYIKLIGTGFVTGCQVVVGTLVATSVTFISSTEVRAQIPQQPAGTYTVYLTNSDGGVAIRVNAVNYSSTPTWTTTSPLLNSVKNTSISLQLAATSNSTVTYSLASGSTLPSGLTLSSSGLLSGTTPDVANETTYNFTVVATDQESQDTPQAFQITIIVVDPYYRLVTLHLPGTGTNLATNNTFLDGSTNNFIITRNGNTSQGTFSPFSQTGWSTFIGSAGYQRWDTNTNYSGTDLTIECWAYATATTSTFTSLVSSNLGTGNYNQYFNLAIDGSNRLACSFYGTSNTTCNNTASFPLNQWVHCAVVLTSAGAVSLYQDGQRVATASSAAIASVATGIQIGGLVQTSGGGYTAYFNGYISNARIVKSVVYSGTTYNVPTSLLTAITNTNLLVCQSNSALDNSGNNYTTGVNTVSRTAIAFSPFNPTSAWSAATVGGSGYFDGTGDYLQAASNAAFNLGTGDFTLEFWVIPTSVSQTFITRQSSASGWGNIQWYLNIDASGTLVLAISTGGSGNNVFANPNIPRNAWSHIAIVRNSSVWYVYLNGVSQSLAAGTAYSASMESNPTGQPLNIGGFPGWGLTTGNIANVRLVKGIPVYTGNFTPPTKPLSNSGSDSASAYPSTTNVNTSFASSACSLLLNFTNAGIYDATSKNVLETVGDAQISNTTAKWGTTSIKFDGTGDYLQATDRQTAQFSSGNWTVEGWINWSSLAGGRAIFNYGYETGGTRAIIIYTTGTNVRVAQSPDGSTNYDQSLGSPSLSTGTWYHLAVVRNGGTVTCYIDGTATGTTATAYTISTSAGAVRIGNDSISYFNGYIQDLRISKYARYTANFTAPTAAFPTL